MTVEEFTYASPLYQKCLELRVRYLRTPLGLDPCSEDTIDDENQRHFAILDGDKIIGGLMAEIESDDSLRFRQMWVDPAHSGSGCGKQLLTSAEIILAEDGFRSFHLRARETARGFYLKCGYQPTGKPFIEVGIPHIAMEKTFMPESSIET
ncbi:GNAT family N-acetyltransferase [Haloferula sp.]|uniref:GNAT family N-acetyltransferase n=1 Tax=Haloferula sp. TaxID=2497595 RepID=UPI00329E2843